MVRKLKLSDFRSFLCAPTSEAGRTLVAREREARRERKAIRERWKKEGRKMSDVGMAVKRAIVIDENGRAHWADEWNDDGGADEDDAARDPIQEDEA